MKMPFRLSFQWKIVLLITIITVINFIDRSSISFAIEPIEQSFGITNAQFGVIASAFSLGYVIMTFCGGILVDRFGTIGIWALSAILWSIATMLLATAGSFWQFFWLRVFLGIAEGVHFPALLRTIADWLPSQWRARAISFGLFGLPFASIAGAPLTTYLIDTFNWQTMFIILGSLGIIWAFLWRRLFRDHRKNFYMPTSTTSSSAPKPKIPWKSILSNPTFQASCWLYFAFGYSVSFFLMWLPGYLTQTHGASIRSTGYLVLPPWICSAGFMLLGGWLSDHLWKRTNSLRISRSYLMGFSMILSGLCFLPIPFSDSLTFDLIWMSLGLGLAFILMAPLYALNADMFPAFSGVVQGISSSYFAVAGILSPSITGWITQLTGNFHAAFYLVTGLSITTSLIVLFFQRPDMVKKQYVTQSPS
ncbi:MAG TPA: MFS transporter [Rhabdochlamydiaceae bacterium]